MSIFTIGLSGLRAAQTALNTTSNNITNVYTPGYNREITLVAEQQPGGGTKVADIQRQFDQFVVNQLNSANSGLAALDSYQTQITQIDSLLGDLDAGLAPIMGDFFSALQDLVDTPSDPAARQGVIGTAQTLTAQFRSLGGYLNSIDEGIGSQLSTEVNQINNNVKQIATLNAEISVAKARSGKAPNGLLNQRDQLVAELNQRIDAELHIQDGNYNITVGNGQPLVSGIQAYSMTTMPSAADPTRTVAGYVDAAGNSIELADSTFTAGTLGGLLSFRTETLTPVQDRVGQMALSLAMAFNEHHQQGTDLNGNAGGEFFSVVPPVTFSHTRNTGTATITGEFTDSDQLKASDYNLRFDAASNEFQVTRRLDGATFQVPMDPATGEVAIGGMLLTIDDPALLNDGDRFQVQPTRRAAAGFETLIGDISELAAGLSNASGDNENALALQNLQNVRVVGGNSTLSQAYGALVGDVGNRSNIVKVNLTSQQSLTEQLHKVQQSESGVNLDEEAANLIRYQQYYQANAKVIEIGSSLFDTILGIRR